MSSKYTVTKRTRVSGLLCGLTYYYTYSSSPYSVYTYVQYYIVLEKKTHPVISAPIIRGKPGTNRYIYLFPTTIPFRTSTDQTMTYSVLWRWDRAQKLTHRIAVISHDGSRAKSLYPSSHSPPSRRLKPLPSHGTEYSVYVCVCAYSDLYTEH